MQKKTVINLLIIAAVAGSVIWGLTYLKKKQDKEKALAAATPVK